MTQTTLIIALFILEVVAFGWLIWEAKMGREKREQILDLEKQILKLEKDGCNIVGMTGMPEASLAKELSIDYACYCLVANWAAGKDMSIITMDLINENLEKGLKNIKDLVFQIVNSS